MSILNILDRKLWSTLLDLDGKLEGIDERISSTNERVGELGKRVTENRERIIKLESNFENYPDKIRKIFDDRWRDKLQEYGSLKQLGKRK